MAESAPLSSAPELPLTERVLRRLGRPVVLWMVLWALIGTLRPAVNAAVLLLLGDEATARWLWERNVLVTWIIGYIVLLALFGTRVLMKRLDAARPAIRRLTAEAATDSAPAIRGIGSTAGPLGITLAITVLTKAGQLSPYPIGMHIVDVAIVFILVVPIATWVWTYGCVLAGLDRLGRQALRLEPFPRDSGLGLRSLGSVAFVGVVIIAAGVIPYLLLVARLPADVIIGVAIFVIGVGLFMSSQWRLHQQMVAAKAAYVREATALYTAAYEPLQGSYDLATLSAQAPLLSAAESLEKRASSTLEWPFDERIVARLVIVATGVVTAVISALVLRQIGAG